MATVTLSSDILAIELTTWEKVAGLLRDQRIPVAAIRSARVVPDALAAVRGLRAPGLGIPGRRKIGTWRGNGRRRFVCVRAGEPALEVLAEGARYDAYLVGAPDIEAIADRLAGRGSG